MIDVMIDLETLGTRQTSAFVAIGACKFDIETGDILDTFSQNIDWDDALKTRDVTGGTLKWWLAQSADAVSRLLKPGAPLKDVLLSFAKWYPRKDDNRVWGNGATFDISMLENAYLDIFGATPWKYWSVRDVRTIADIASNKCSRKKAPFKREDTSTPHVALDDALYQAEYVSAMWQTLRK